MGVSLGAAHKPSSSFFGLVGPDGFELLEDLMKIAIDGGLDISHGFEKKINEIAFEQATGQVSIGLVIVNPSFVDSIDLGLNRLKRSGLNVEQNEGAVNILPAGIGFDGGEIGELEETFEDEKTGFDPPSTAIKLSETLKIIAFFVEQGGEQDFGFTGVQRNAD